MLGFVIPLKSKQNSQNWALVQALLNRTLRSLTNQISRKFVVILVCNEVPTVDNDHANLEILKVDTKLPATLSEKIEDKSLKIYLGAMHLKKHAPEFVMPMDADDCISCNLTSYVMDGGAVDGYYLRSGYMSHENSPLLHLERFRFHQWCGSSNVIRMENMNLPTQWRSDWRFAHRDIVKIQGKMGARMRPVPFPAAVYNVSHGENFYNYAPILWPSNIAKRSVRRILYHRKLTEDIRKEFSLYPIDIA